MNLKLLAAFLPFCTFPLSQAADLFAPLEPKADPHAAYQNFKSSTEFFDATRKGEVPELIKNFRGNYNGIIQLLLVIFKKDNRYPNISQSQASNGAVLLEIITRYELAAENKKAEIEWEYKTTRGHSFVLREDADFINPCESFLKDYALALREYIENKKEREIQQITAETERRRLAEMAAKKAQEERHQTMTSATAKAESIRAEEKLRESSVMNAIAAQGKIREQKLQESLASPTYKIWQESLKIEEGLQMVEKAKQILSVDDAIQRESGVSDLAMRRSAGERLFAGKLLVEQAFDAYKKLGGQARKPEEVKAGTDPAKDFR